MATIADISNALGDYMLKGWVLTDQACPTPGCTVPLVRSPRGRTPVTNICVKCGENASKAVDNPTSSNASTSESHVSRSLTPPTEVSEIPESPVFAPIEESEQSRRRREQSDRASEQIGKKLLQGWAMLGDECPNESCYGVPLVRRPKAGGEKDPRKECVICGKVYVTEVDWAGRETLVPYGSNTESEQKSQAVAQSASASSAKESAATDIVQHFSSPFGRQENHVGENQRHSRVMPANVPPSDITATAKPSSSGVSPSEGLYDQTSAALQQSLRALSTKLMSFGPYAEPSSIGATADAISKVALALVNLQPLQQNQTRMH
ncbi:hypothetical protein D9613_005187 [Agrocybe pediades]|uniref:Uncharacterized protein n=1 Tax=Agrocybe pediades TaxID=84607 RepID=A0A8H4R027_9AGAR|nr:hypothetical protein D9613_005187 [Agrocybe pediades]